MIGNEMRELFMKTSIRWSINKVLFSFSIFICGLLLSSSNVFSGSWTTEYNVEGMDAAHIYLPTTFSDVNNKHAITTSFNHCEMRNEKVKNDIALIPGFSLLDTIFENYQVSISSDEYEVIFTVENGLDVLGISSRGG